MRWRTRRPGPRCRTQSARNARSSSGPTAAGSRWGAVARNWYHATSSWRLVMNPSRACMERVYIKDLPPPVFLGAIFHARGEGRDKPGGASVACRRSPTPHAQSDFYLASVCIQTMQYTAVRGRDSAPGGSLHCL